MFECARKKSGFEWKLLDLSSKYLPNRPDIALKLMFSLMIDKRQNETERTLDIFMTNGFFVKLSKIELSSLTVHQPAKVCVNFIFEKVCFSKTNKTRTSKVGAISMAQKAQNILLGKKCRIVPKKVKGAPF